MINIINLTKSYKTSTGRHYLFKDLNIYIPSGKSVAFIGRNGAGKSTLLRIIAGIDRPDSGSVVSDKTISWPVGLSGGFQGSLTGRENVKFVSRLYTYKKDLKEKIRFVKDFSDIGKYFDMPIKTYSSGMRSRLSFGVSMAFKFDYYIIDEVTSVGDANFRNKCATYVKKLRAESNFLMVSHNLSSLKEYCDAALLFKSNRTVIYYDDISDAIEAYIEDNKL
ncbi:ABC transporter ATP-binding protein [Escherichia coli]|nr:ABC transporter ATP-binding protein [Escherichia coli]